MENYLFIHNLFNKNILLVHSELANLKPERQAKAPVVILREVTIWGKDRQETGAFKYAGSSTAAISLPCWCSVKTRWALTQHTVSPLGQGFHISGGKITFR